MQSMFYNCRKLSELDLSNWIVNITNTSYTSGMFNYCYALNTVIFGDGVKLLGSMLPTPSATYIPGADGKWHTVSGEAYTNSQIPNNKAETYFAVVPGDNTLFSDNQILEITNQLIFQDSEGNILATYPIVDSGFESLYPEAPSETGYWSDPEQDENGNLIISWIEPEPSDIIADEILEDTTETIEIEEEDTPLTSNNPASSEGTEGGLLEDNESEADQTEGQLEGEVEEGKSDGEIKEGQSDGELEGKHTEGQLDGESEEAVDLNNGQSTNEELTEGKVEEQLDEADTDEEENSETLQLDTSDITE